MVTRYSKDLNAPLFQHKLIVKWIMEYVIVYTKSIIGVGRPLSLDFVSWWSLIICDHKVIAK